MSAREEVDHWIERLWPLSSVLFVLDGGPAVERGPWTAALQPGSWDDSATSHPASRKALLLNWNPHDGRPLASALSSLVGMGDLAARKQQDDDIQAWLTRLAERGTPDAFIVLHGVDGWLTRHLPQDDSRESLDKRWFHNLISGGHEHLHLLVVLDLHSEPELLEWQNHHPWRAQPHMLKRIPGTTSPERPLHPVSPDDGQPDGSTRAAPHTGVHMARAVAITAAVIAGLAAAWWWRVG